MAYLGTYIISIHNFVYKGSFNCNPKWNWCLCTSHSQLIAFLSGTSLVPSSSVWVEKKEAGTHCLCMLRFPRISGNLKISENFYKICSITLTSARYANFSCIKDACHWPHSVWSVTKEQWRYSALRLQELSTCSCIPAKHCNTWLMQSLPLKFTDHFKRSNADSYCRSNIVWLKNHPYEYITSAAFQQVDRIDHNFSVAE